MVEDKSCSEIIGPWRFSKESIKKMIQITDNTKIIERGGILCIRTEKTGEKRIDIISECKGTKCDLQVDAFGEVTSTHTEMYEQAISLNKETLSEKGRDVSKESSIQAPPFRAG